jgi:hypothetical protein
VFAWLDAGCFKPFDQLLRSRFEFQGFSPVRNSGGVVTEFQVGVA